VIVAAGGEMVVFVRPDAIGAADDKPTTGAPATDADAPAPMYNGEGEREFSLVVATVRVASRYCCCGCCCWRLLALPEPGRPMVL